MSADDFGAKADQGLGAAEEVIGQAAGRPDMMANGEIRRARGRTKESVESAKKAFGQAAEQAAATVVKAADQAASTVSRAADQASSLYATARDAARSVSVQVDPFVNERPYAAVAIGLVAGILVGALFFGRGAKVIYVRTPSR